MKSLLTAAAVLVLAATPAIADEVWLVDGVDEIIYEEDIDNYAVLSYPGEEDGIRDLAFIEDLAGNYDDRGRHDGYWTSVPVEEDEGCGIWIIDHTGRETNAWGRLEVIFVDEAFPSTFVAQGGWCFEEPEDEIVARPLTADDYDGFQDDYE